MIIQINDDYFVVLDDEFNKVKEEFKDNWVVLSQWIEDNGVFVSGQAYVILNKQEAKSLVQEFEKHYISRENLLGYRTFDKIDRFARKEVKDAGES